MGSKSLKKYRRGSQNTRVTAAPKQDCTNKGKAVARPIFNLNPNVNLNYGSGSEDQLKEKLLNKLHWCYNEALSKLVAMGFDEDLALQAILRNGYCYGSMDVVSNILKNVMAYLNSVNCGGGEGFQCESEDKEEEEDKGDGDDSGEDFSNLRQLEEYSLAEMVSLLQKNKPKLSKVDSMWCLLMCDLHVARATSFEITSYEKRLGKDNVSGVKSTSVRFCGCGDPSCSLAVLGSEILSRNAKLLNLQRDSEGMKIHSLLPHVKSMLKKNVANFSVGFQANAKSCASVSEGAHHSALSYVSSNNQSVKPFSRKGIDDINEMLSKFSDMLLEDKMEAVTYDQNEGTKKTILKRIDKLEGQVDESKEWAQQKALQAARKLSNDLIELAILRIEKAKTLNIKKRNKTLDESTMKKMSSLENALRKASRQVEHLNATVRPLEIENAQIRAEIEVAKLSISESVKGHSETKERERKSSSRSF